MASGAHGADVGAPGRPPPAACRSLKEGLAAWRAWIAAKMAGSVYLVPVGRGQKFDGQWPWVALIHIPEPKRILSTSYAVLRLKKKKVHQQG